MNRDDWRARHDDPRTLAAYNMITVEQARLEGIEDALRAEGCRGKWLPVFLQGTVTRRNRDAVLALAEAQAPAWRRLGEVLGEVAARRTGRPVEVRIRPYAPGEGGPGAHEMGWGAMREDGAVHLDGKLLDGPCPPRRGIGRWRTRMALVLAVLEHECGHVLHDPRWLTRPRVVVGPWWDKVAEYYLREGRMEREAVASGVEGRRERLRLAFAGMAVPEVGGWPTAFAAGEHLVCLVGRIAAGVIDEEEVPATLAALTGAVGKRFAARVREVAGEGVALPRTRVGRMLEIAAGIGGPPRRFVARSVDEGLRAAAEAEMERLVAEGLRATRRDVAWVEEAMRGTGS